MKDLTGTTDAILMASGFSKRFGPRNKLLTPFRGKPLLQYPLDLLTSLSVFNKIFLVYNDPNVLEISNPYPIHTIYNARPELGQRESIRLGVSASNADFYLFVPCDQPLLDANTIHTILARQSAGCIIEPTYDGKPGSPVLFSKSFRKELLTLCPASHARELKRHHKDSLVRVPISNQHALFDIDTPEDLERLEVLFGNDG
ncbi:nucleotidyltransferase family protein [Ruminococcaceae bacterium OttesenSCG-928-I18]|nr:nucleotidyltransferase family protein [Ruminococcaceae bacterium OttesenSCG-928-I18]